MERIGSRQKRKAGIIIGFVLVVGIVATISTKSYLGGSENEDVQTNLLVESGYALDPVLAEGYSVCGYEGTSIVANHFFETLNEFQTTGANNPALTKTLKSLVTNNVLVVDQSNGKQFGESGTYSNKAGFESWLDKTTPKNGFGLTTNYFLKYKGSNLCEIAYKDEVITDIAFPTKLNGADRVTLPKKDEDVKLEKGKLIVTAVKEGSSNQCKIEKVVSMRKILADSQKDVELTPIDGMHKDEIDGAKALDKIRREIRKRQAAKEVEKLELVKHDQNRACVTKLEHHLALHDGLYETLDAAHQVSADVSVYYVDDDGAEKIVRGEDMDKLAFKQTDAGRKLRRIGVAMRSARIVEKDGSRFFAISPDKSAVEVLSNSCEISRVFISTGNNDYHPVVKEELIGLIIAAVVVGTIVGAGVYYGVQYGVGTSVTEGKTDYIDSTKGFPSGLTPRNNWMRNFGSTKEVRKISLPGTHDSGAKVWPAGCQTKSITEQLKMGVRYFDLRLKYWAGHWAIFHGIIPQLYRVSTVVSELRNYVRANPTEFVAVNFQIENMDNALSSHENSKLSSTLFGGSSEPWLSDYVRSGAGRHQYGQVKGKIFAVCKTYHKGQAITAFTKICNDNWHDTSQNGKTWGADINAKDYAPQIVNSLKWLSHNAENGHNVRFRRIQWNGYCYSPWLWVCNPVQGPYKFAAVANEKIWYSYFEFDSYPSHKFSAVNAIDYPGAKLISRIIASNNHRIGNTGEPDAPRRPPPPSPAPAPSGCFSSGSAVLMEDGTRKWMKDVQAGDLLAGGGAVYFVGHRDHGVVSEFVRFETIKFGKSVSATRDHFLGVHRGGERMNIRFGDLLKEKENGEKKFEVEVNVDGKMERDWILMSSVGVVKERGLYNPYTMSGSAIVNDVVVSCHSSYVLDDYLGGSAWDGYLPGIYQWMFSPFRMVYRLWPSLAVEMDGAFPQGIGEYPFGSVMIELGKCVGKKIGLVVHWASGVWNIAETTGW